jgi:putative peptidoglycan lipid II flippase
MVCAQQLDWLGMGQNKPLRAAWLVAVVLGAAAVYFGALLAAGLPWRTLLRRAV